jgi:tetratricopeptide (TPR) repeat protein
LGKNFETNASRFDMLGNSAQAISDYERSWKISRDPQELIRIAQIYYFDYLDGKNSDLSAAETAVKEFIRHVPQLHHGYQILGRIYASQGKLNESLSQYELALERNPQFNTGLKAEYLDINMKLKNYSLVASKAEEYADYLKSQTWPDYMVSGRNNSISNFLNLEMSAYKELGNNERAEEIKKEIAILTPFCKIITAPLSEALSL